MICDPRIYGALHDDFAGSAEDWEPEYLPGIIGYVKVTDGEDFLGLMKIGKHSPVQWEIHNALLPYVGWKRRLTVAREILPWLQKFGCRRLIAKVPFYNGYSIKFSEASGMQRIGVNEKAFMKGGVLVDEVWFGLSLGEVA